MTSINPIPTTRVSNQLAATLLLDQLRANQTELLRLQQRISSGRRIFLPSEDAPAAARAISLQRLLERKAQVKTNLETNQFYLTATDTALASVSDLLNDARGHAISASGTTITAAQRESAAQEIDRLLEDLANLGNRQIRGRYLFAGSSNGAAPFALDGDFVQYRGNEVVLRSYSDIDVLFPTNVTGNDVFGALSAHPPGEVDLNPIVTADTPLAQLNGGAGVSLGSVEVADGSHVRVVDLSNAATLGDVAALLEAQTAGADSPRLRVEITNFGVQLTLVGGGTLEIREVGGGTTARELGILAVNNATPTVVGSDLNPQLTTGTPLANILGTRAKASVVSPGNDNNFTIEARQRGAGFNGYSIQFVDSGSVVAGSETVDITGTTITVDIDAGQTTAAQVVDALNADAAFSALFNAQLDSHEPEGSGLVSLAATATTSGGSGIEFDQASGLQIANGTATYTIDIASASTIEDLLNLINGAGAAVLAEINAAGTGVTIRSRLSGADFSIGENGGSTASQLGFRSLPLGTRLDELSHGLGVHTLAQQNVGGDDFAIQLQDGDVLHFRLDGQTTIADVIDLINNHPDNAGRLTARLAAVGNGLELVSTAVGATTFAVLRENNSQGAEDLGLIAAGETISAPPGGGGATITGRGVNPGETPGLFTALVRLRTALRAGDQLGINRAVELIDNSATQVNFIRAEVGARQQGLEVLQDRLDSETTDLQAALSGEIDVDLPEAISNLTALQAAYQASLQVAGQLSRLSLLDFL